MSFVSSLFDLKTFLRLDPTSLTPARRRAVEVAQPRGMLRPCQAYLDGCEHDGTAWCGRNDDQRGARFRARFESRHNLVSGRSKDLNHDAVMRIGSEAPKRRTHSSNRHEAKGHVGIPPPRTIIGAVTSERTRPKLSRYLQHPPFIVQDAKRRRPVQRPPERAATERSKACVPRPRSWSCECRGRSRCGLETTAPKRCSSGT